MEEKNLKNLEIGDKLKSLNGEIKIIRDIHSNNNKLTFEFSGALISQDLLPEMFINDKGKFEIEQN